MLRVAAALALLVAVLAAPGAAQDVTTTETTTTTTFETTTAPPTTVVETQTAERTRTEVHTVEPTTTANEGGSGETPTWVWVLVGALAVGLIAAVVALIAGRRGPQGVPLEQRQRQLRGAVNSWVAQGWAVESDTADSAVLRRGSERMLITVDAAGQVGSRALS